MIAVFLLMSAAADAPAPPAPDLARALRDSSPSSDSAACKSADPESIVVCGRAHSPYRIDPVVLQVQRSAETLPAKPSDIAAASTGSEKCVGPQNCGSGTVPLVGMALAAAKAAALAAQGEDWREAFRSRPDAYKSYQQEKSRKPRLRGGISARPE